MNSRLLEYFLNALFWGVTAWLIASSFSIQAQEFEMVDGTETVTFIRNESLQWKILACVAVAALVSYLNLWNILRLRTDQTQRKSVILLAVALLLVVITLFPILENWWAPFPAITLPATLRNGILLFYFTFFAAYGLAKVWWSTYQQQQQLVLARKQAELQLLRNQLQPHFLFNALNNLLALVNQQQSPLLADSIERLSQLLRYVIDETRAGQVSIQQEIEFIRNYVEVQLLRFDPGEVHFDLQVEGDYYQQQIEPGLFIPFVENAFKYGTEPEQESKISCHFDLNQPDAVVFSIQNQIRLQSADRERNGTGIASTRRRLELIYPGRHQLEVRQDANFIVQLNIQTHDGDNS